MNIHRLRYVKRFSRVPRIGVIKRTGSRAGREDGERNDGRRRTKIFATAIVSNERARRGQNARSHCILPQGRVNLELIQSNATIKIVQYNSAVVIIIVIVTKYMVGYNNCYKIILVFYV